MVTRPPNGVAAFGVELRLPGGSPDRPTRPGVADRRARWGISSL